MKELLTKLLGFQKKALNQALNEEKRFGTKKTAKKRYVCGLREVLRKLKTNKIRLVIVVPNIENVLTPGGLNELQLRKFFLLVNK